MTEAPNLTKMRAGVAKWIADAAQTNRIAGVKYLRGRGRWVTEQMGKLATKDEPPHLAGLTVADLLEAESALNRAADELERQP